MAAPTAEQLQSILAAARAGGASAADASLSDSTATTVTVRNGEVETVEFQHDRDLNLSVYLGQCTGNASTSDLSEAGIRRAVEAAIAIARATGADPCNGLAPAERMAQVFPDLDLYHPWEVAVPEAIERARACEAAALGADPRIKQSEGATLETRFGVQHYANTHGFLGERRGSHQYLGVSVIAADERGMQRDYEYSSSRHVGDLADGESIGRAAADKTLARLNSRKPPTGRLPVLFRSDVARGLFGHFIGAISGGALYRKASFLLDQVGQPVFSPLVNLSQQPFLPRAMASASFDNEGVATADRALVSDGVLQGYLLASYSARKLGLESTGNAGGVFNLVAEATAGDLQELQARMGTGLLVTELMGQGVSTVTGDYSRGAAGFWVENGEIAYPVEEITIAGNLRQMFKGIQAIGSDVDLRGSVRCGSILVDGLTVAAGD